MNKSLVFKNKFYLFFSFLFSFFLFLYLMHFLLNGQRGIINYLKLKNENFFFQQKYNSLNQQNNFLLDRIERLQPNTLDLDYLDEILRKNTGFLKKNEVKIIIE